jgi:hypothetical protein
MTTTMTAVCAALLGSLIVAAPARADADSYIATLDVMGVPYRIAPPQSNSAKSSVAH